MKKIDNYILGRYKSQKNRTSDYLPTNIHKMCLDNVPIVSVDVVIFNKKFDKVLLFKRNNNPLKGEYYSIGGRVQKNESLIDTAKRKLKEEAGIYIAYDELCFGGLMEEFYENSVYNGVDTHNINIFFSYVAKNTRSFELDCQHSKYRWCDIDSEHLHPYIFEKIDVIINN